MADDEERASGGIPGVMQDFLAQLRGVAERLEGLTGLGSVSLPAMPSMPSLAALRSVPLPGALSAAQLKAIASSVGAQRRSIQALRSQLEAFDEQLAVLERILDPLAEWSKTWADIEERLTKLRLGSGGEGQGRGS
jgi:hypothetical protein